MAKTAPRTILLKGRGYRMERIAAGAITPGHLVALDSNNKLAVHAVAGGKALPCWAVEMEHLGNNARTSGDIDTAYAANDFVQAEILSPGCEVYALLPANAPAIVIGDVLESAGDGTLRKALTLTGTLTGTNDGALADITFNATWSSAQANEINSNFEEIQARLNASQPSGIAIASEAVDNSAVAAVARIKVIVL
jgi:hypothetical protein